MRAPPPEPRKSHNAMKQFKYNDAAATERIIAPVLAQQKAEKEYALASVRRVLDAAEKPLSTKDICAAHRILSGSGNLNERNVGQALIDLGDEVAMVAYEREDDARYAFTSKMSPGVFIDTSLGQPDPAAETDEVQGAPGSRVILTRHFAKFHWPSLAVGDNVEGVGLIKTPLLCQLVSDYMPNSLAEAMASMPKPHTQRRP